MSDDQTATETPTAEQPQEGAEQQADAKTFDADYVKKLRDEAAKYRTEAKANAKAADELAKIQDANKSEADKQAERLAQAEERAKALATVHGFLDDIGISYGGRYGEWGYLWTDEAFKSGENAAQKALERMSSSVRA